MRKIITLLLLVFCFTSFSTKNAADRFEVYYDSKLVSKEAIQLATGKSIQVVNASNGKIYKVELAVVLGKRPCYQKTYLNEEAAKPISVDPFVGGACAGASSIMLTVNVSTIVVIPISQ